MSAHLQLMWVEGIRYWQLIRVENTAVCRSCDLCLQVVTDTHQKCIFRGRHLVTRFSDIEYVEQRREKTRVGIFYWVRLHLKRSRKLNLGYQDSNVAITIADVIEKPVRGGDSWL